MQPLFRYGLDLNGNSPDNFVSDESHVLSTRRNRAVVSKAGPFYANSVVMTDMGDYRVLVRGVDYVPVELNQILSIKTGKDIFGALLVINRHVSSNVKISYQAVGGENEQTAQTLFDLLEKIPDEGLDFSWYEISDKPNEWLPTPHFHPLGSPYGFEKLTHVLDRIQHAIKYTDLPTFRNLLSYINQIFDEINQSNKFKMDAYFGPQLVAFKKLLTKTYFELENVSNYLTASEDDGRIAARSDSISKNFPVTKYVAINALVSFKNSLYNNFVLSETTHIGLANGDNISPDANSIINLKTGSMRLLVSKELAVLNSENINLSIYPQDVDIKDNFVITKISGNRDNSGGVYFLIERSGTKFYIVKHVTGNVVDNFIHLRLSTDSDFNELLLNLDNHLADFTGTHNVTAEQVDLGFVEDLDIITVEEILCLDNKRKYITFDQLILFMKTFMIGKNEGDIAILNGEQNPVELLDIFKCASGVVEEAACCPEPTPCPPPPPPPPAPPPVVPTPPVIQA